MAKITGVHHIALTPTKENYEKTLNFYKEILGCKEVCSWGGGDDKCAMVSCGDNTVMEIMSRGETDNMGDGAFVHVAFCCEEVDQLIAEVIEAGYEVTMEPKDITLASTPPMPVRVAFFRGPVNEHIELFKVY